MILSVMEDVDASKRFISCSLRELLEGVDVTCLSLGVSKMTCYGVSGICNLKIRFHWWISRSFGALKEAELTKQWHLVVLICEFKERAWIKLFLGRRVIG